MRAGADLRLLRAAVFAAACTTLAASGHVWATGPGVRPATLAAGWAAAFAVALPLTGRERRSVPAMAGLLAVSQLALHVVFCIGRHASPGRPPAPSARELAARLLCNDHMPAISEREAARIVAASGLGDAHTAPTAGAAGAAHAGGAGGAGSGLGEAFASLASPPMLLGHLAAALAAGWLLRRGEAALWAAVRLSLATPGVPPLAALAPLRRAARLLRLLRVLCGAPLPEHARVPGRVRSAELSVPVLHEAVLSCAVSRRGPPAPATHQHMLAA
ncbi:hypothetical protein [Streptomyces sp. SBT349]|uniref:hypothetical protein n=1 Tax=Streptomyces sp. SBT349 TaxID=1580539 RepID=UPI00066AD593|nr:hypothetical protein [Streptomyces sp. SBT349]